MISFALFILTKNTLRRLVIRVGVVALQHVLHHLGPVREVRVRGVDTGIVDDDRHALAGVREALRRAHPGVRAEAVHARDLARAVVVVGEFLIEPDH